MTDEIKYISRITVDDNTYDIRDDAAQTAITSIQSNLANILNPSASSAYKTALKNAIIDMLYPVGSVYISMSTSAPFSHGTWQRIGGGRALVGYSPNSDLFTHPGDEYGFSNSALLKHTHTGTVSNHRHTMSHNHNAGSGRHFATFTGTGSVEEIGPIANGNYEIIQIKKSGTWHTTQTTTSGSSEAYTGYSQPSVSINASVGLDSLANRNYQPSIAVSVWKRVG